MPEPGLADLIGLETAPRSVEYGWKDVVLYALGVGVPVEDLGFLYERASGGLQVLPSYCVIPEYEAMVDLETRFDRSRMLHGEQTIRTFRPIPPQGTLVVTGKVVNIFDKGKAAVIHSSATGSTVDGEKVFETLKVGFYRGGGGFGGDPGPRAEVLDPPAGVRPDLDITYTIPQGQAALYRLNGDYNPLHIDPEFARTAGFDRPILHGLCTYGFAVRAIVERLCDGEVGRFREFKARFSDVVFPGEELTTRGWKENGRTLIQVSTPRGVVISNAYAITD